MSRPRLSYAAACREAAGEIDECVRVHEDFGATERAEKLRTDAATLRSLAELLDECQELATRHAEAQIPYGKFGSMIDAGLRELFEESPTLASMVALGNDGVSLAIDLALGYQPPDEGGATK